jgi:hypothetical protein
MWVWLVVGALASMVGCADDPEDSPDEVAEALAHDIDIALVELNQGVAITLARDGDWIAPQEREAPVVMGRDAIVRVHWTTAAGFEARPILVRLTLERLDREQPIVVEQTAMISADGALDLVVDGADMVPGLRFRVALLEQDPAYVALPPSSSEPISPRDDSAPIGVRLEPTAMKLVLVPLTLEWSGCSTSVELAELAQRYDDMAFQKSPTGMLTTEVREQPLVITSEPASIVDLLEPIQQLRAAEQADAAAYYYGVYEPCGALVDDLDGVAPIAVADPAAGWLRVGVGTLDGDLQRSADVFMHQLGHLQGLGHVECPGTTPTEPDPDYPHASGLVGVWGFGLRDGMVRAPESAHDFMSYCYDGNWSSDWTWAKAFERIATVTSWEAAARPAVDDATILLGWLGADGHERWWTTSGRIPEQILSEDPVLALARSRGRVEAVASARLELPDAEGELIAVELEGEVPEVITFVDTNIEIPTAALARARGE